MSEHIHGLLFILKKSLLSTLISLAALLLLTALSGLLLQAGMSVTAIAAMSWIITALCALLCGFASAKAVGERGALCGLTGGILLFVLLFVTALFFAPEFDPAQVLIKLAVCAALGAAGGICGVNIAGGRRRRKKRK